MKINKELKMSEKKEGEKDKTGQEQTISVAESAVSEQ